jgi:DNA polymerase-1
MTQPQSPLFMIIDGHSLAFRAYYALAKTKKGPLRTSTGIPTSVCFGFLNSLFQVIEQYQPQFLAIAFDLKEPTFRHEADLNYKADRQETPPDFLVDVGNLQKLLVGFNLPLVTAVGYEADDVIGTLAIQGAKENYTVKIVSGDRDLFQLVNNQQKISVLYLERNLGKYQEFDESAVEEKMGVKTEQIVDYKALCGDKSDNIPGVRGIGDKTAIKLLNEYQSLSQIYENINQIKGAIKSKLIAGKKDALHSQYLAKIVTDIQINQPISEYKMQGFVAQKIIPLLEELELNNFVKQLQKIQQKLGGNQLLSTANKETDNEQQLSLFSPITSTQIKPLIIDSSVKLEELLKILATKTNLEQPTAWDTETDSLDTQAGHLVGIGCCWGKTGQEIAYIPLRHSQGQQLQIREVIPQLKPILESTKYPKVLQNAKFDRLILANEGINLEGVVFDTMLASYVINPEESHKLSNLSIKYLTDIIAQDYEDLGLEKNQSIADLDIAKAASYCGLDCLVTFQLVPILQTELNKNKASQSVFELELKLEPILAQMEADGVRIDADYLQELSQQIERDLIKIETQVYQQAGEKFNLASPQQLSRLLFENLGLDRRKSRKTKTGYSTNQAILEKMKGDHPIIENILQYRSLAKLKSTYVDTLPTLINPRTQRVHTNYNQTVTTTGRLSSSNPNLQNIPIRSEFSRQIRKAFIPRGNWLFLGADYSQIELRILAHLSGEPILIEAYQTNQDIHTVTAKLLFNKSEINSQERSLGKTINFGVIYGMGAQKFARETGVTVSEAQEFINIYRDKYARVFEYLSTMKQEALAYGYVTTILGRKRYFNFNDPDLNKLRGSKPWTINLDELKLNNYDAQLLRAAANAPIQGSSADIIKMAMVEINQILADYEAKLLLQVHDELVFELPSIEIEDLKPKIKTTMENVIKLKIPLVVDVHVGKNWMETK